MNKQKYISLVAGLVVLGSLATAVSALAVASPQGTGRFGGGINRGGMPAVVGTVSAISGNTITVNGKQGFNSSTTATSFSVDATNAKITKNNAVGTVSSIAVGDTVMAQGTVSGTNVVAKTIRDGVPQNRAPQAQPQIQGNGQPVVAGKITAINGSAITITNSSNITYSVDASGAKFVATGVTSPTISNVAVGDNVIVQGTVNGNSVVASSVIDQKAKVNGATGNLGNNGKAGAGFMGGVVDFFKHLFGF